MGRARDRWEELSTAFEKVDTDVLYDVYTPNALYLEPHNPPHEGNKLIQAYLADWLKARDNIDVSTKRTLESEDGTMLAVEWTISYTAAGRRWTNLARSSWFEVSDDGITYHRDYL